jgi:hypothetical protein
VEVHFFGPLVHLAHGPKPAGGGDEKERKKRRKENEKKEGRMNGREAGLISITLLTHT